MTRSTRLKRLALAAMLALALPVSASAQTLSLSRDEAIGLARQAWLAGDVALARAIAERIEKVEPRNVEALLLMSATSAALGKPEEAIQFGRRAWAAARSAGRPKALQREIALQAMQSSLLNKSPRRAAYWLERAIEVTDNAAEADRMRSDLAILRSKTPLHFSMGLQIVPTDNLNSGASSGLFSVEDLVIGGLSGWSVAHAGVIVYPNVGMEYDLGLSPSGKAKSKVSLSFAGEFHRLTDEEAQENPELDASELDTVTATLGFSQDRLVPNLLPGPMHLSLQVAKSWPVGSSYAPNLRASVDLPLTGQQADTQLALTLGLQRLWIGGRSGIGDGANLRLMAERGVSLPWGQGTLSAAVSLDGLASDFSNTTYNRARLDFVFDPGMKLGPITPRLGLGLSYRHYDEYDLILFNSSNGRTDKGINFSASFGLEEVKIAGFTPALTLQRTKTWSNISKYQTDSTNLQFSLVSKF